MKSPGLLIAVLITASMLFESCSTTKTDAEIRTEIEKRLKASPDMAGVMVDVSNGIVSITGDCSSETTRADCEKMAQNISGVKTVINNIAVPSSMVALPPEPAPAPLLDTAVAPVATVPEDPLTPAVATALKRYPTVKADVTDGIITLTGTIKKTELPGLLRSMKRLNPKRVDQKLSFTQAQRAKKPVKKTVKSKKRSRRN